MAKRILVAVKRVVDYNARIRVKPDKVRLSKHIQQEGPFADLGSDTVKKVADTSWLTADRSGLDKHQNECQSLL